MKPKRRKCTATTRRGTPCRNWAKHDGDPPLCAAHTGYGALPAADQDKASSDPGFYVSALLPTEAGHVLPQGCLSLDEEIALARVCLLRVAEALKQNGSLTPEQRIRLATLIFRGASTIARLLRDRQAVADEAGEVPAAAISRALDEVAKVLGVEL
jgi:hypothetical protein